MGPPETRVTVSDASRGGQSLGQMAPAQGPRLGAPGLILAPIRKFGDFSPPGRTTVWCADRSADVWRRRREGRARICRTQINGRSCAVLTGSVDLDRKSTRLNS